MQILEKVNRKVLGEEGHEVHAYEPDIVECDALNLNLPNSTLFNAWIMDIESDGLEVDIMKKIIAEIVA